MSVIARLPTASEYELALSFSIEIANFVRIVKQIAKTITAEIRQSLNIAEK